MANIQVLEKNVHQNLKLEDDKTLSHARQSHIVQVTVFELTKVAAEYPIAFIKDRDTGQFHLVALLGLQPQENLFFDSQRWRGNYIPMQLRTFPFVLTKHPDEADKHLLCVDLDSEFINEHSGEALFDGLGNQSQFLTDKAGLLGQLMEQMASTQEFVNILAQNELLSPQSLSITSTDGEEYSLTGLYAIDEAKLNDLSSDSYQELRQLGLISPIYACLFSMGRIENLVRLKALKP